MPVSTSTPSSPLPDSTEPEEAPTVKTAPAEPAEEAARTAKTAGRGPAEGAGDAGDAAEAREATGDAAEAKEPAGEAVGEAVTRPAEDAPEVAPQDAAGDASEDAADTPGAAGVVAEVRWWRWRSRHPRAARVVWWTVTVLAFGLVLGALLLPNRISGLQVNRFTRLPVEAIIGAALLLALPRRPRTVVAVLGGVLLGALTVLNVLDMEFTEYLGRDFDLVLDWGLLDDAQSYVADSMGRATAVGAAVGLVLLVVLLSALMALATVRIGNLMARDTRRATRATLIAATAWVTCSVVGLQIADMPVASHRSADTLVKKARQVRQTIKDEATFGKEVRHDTFGATPADQLVPDLRGKDMIFTFIESYGRSAIEDPVMAPGVDRTLGTSTQALAKAGFHAKSGWLTSATYGGSSWLGHSSTLSGLWVDNQQRYRSVMASDHLSLTKAFKKTGAWDTVGVMPGIQKGWPEAKYYGLEKVYNAFEMGYQGPKFSWSTMPDQYALEAFQRLEHGRTDRDKPLMSEIILTSSHQPWAPIPKMVDWDSLGDGSVFEGIEKDGRKASDVIADGAASKEEYGKSIQYSVTALTQWLERYGTDDTVLVVLGDHQPIARVSGDNASRDVPISLVAKDPKVLDKIAGWNWTDGLRPAHNAPVWKMSAFRDKFLTAYGSTPHPTG
ncbi:CDP-alcohol phosphatidyltransferase [Streptomyces sp. ID05-04B]|uniref:CDP-alcohol phosphatidyltransferase n=1 Tax=Streptomyces sp. ID05-04B TaxID=3028661 RepID=UPI0029C5F206|nr:CDP-alcohol phosphatidyltransferase [Streptomyces sp. ID05-04B]MDX5564965.1 CDP-alcohol phosphatidyltransferase [Streptomyces sp. ID05-04B]